MQITKKFKKINQYFLTQKTLVIKNIYDLSSYKKKLIKKNYLKEILVYFILMLKANLFINQFFRTFTMINF